MPVLGEDAERLVSGNGKHKCPTCGTDVSSPGECAKCKEAAQKLLDDLKKKPKRDED